MIRTVYFDLDGVLFDCQVAAKAGLGKDKWESKEFWGYVNNTPNFFRNLPVLTGAHELLAQVRELLPKAEFRVLSATGDRFGEVAPQKVQAVLEHFSDYFRQQDIILARAGVDKAAWAFDGSLLIDDTDKVCQAFYAAGGRAIVHYDVEVTTNLIKFALAHEL